MVSTTLAPPAETDIDAKALFKEAQRRARRRQALKGLVALVLLGAGIGLGLGVTSGGRAPSARALHRSAHPLVPVFADRTVVYTTWRAGFNIPHLDGSTSQIDATVQLWSNTNSQDCSVTTFDGLAPQQPLCQEWSVFLGSGDDQGVGAWNAAVLPTKTSLMLRDLAKARGTGSSALDHSLDDPAPVDEPLGGPIYNKAFERATLLLVGPVIGATPAFHTALFNALLQLPGVNSLGQMTSDLGAIGIGFSAATLMGTTTVIVDPNSGQLLEIRNTDDGAFNAHGGRNIVAWLDPVGSPKSIAMDAVPPGISFATPPNEEINATVPSNKGPQLQRVDTLVRRLIHGYPGASLSGGATGNGQFQQEIEFSGTRAEQVHLAQQLRESGLFSRVTLGPSGGYGPGIPFSS